jgi:short-subunit dehydrogenase
MQANMMKSTDVARIGFNALKKGKPLVIAGGVNKITTWIQRAVPRRWAIKVAAKVIETRYDAKV